MRISSTYSLSAQLRAASAQLRAACRRSESAGLSPENMLIARSKCRTAGYANAFTGHITRQVGYQKLHYAGAIFGRTQPAKRIGLCLSLRAQVARGGLRLDSRALDNAGRDAIDPHTVGP